MERIILKFLQKNYPITKIKHGKHFKRGVILDNGNKLLLNDKGTTIVLEKNLTDILQLIFAINRQECLGIVKIYLQKLIQIF